MKGALIALALLAPLASCNAAEDTKAGEAAIVTFHNALNAANFDQIYTDTDPEFKSVTTRQDFNKVLAAIHKKLGNFQSGKTVGWNDNATTGGHYLTLNAEAKYDRGTAHEQFVFKISKQRAALAGYNINSTALITG
jgi:hypothetical protein